MSKHDSGKWGRNGTEAERLRREGWTRQKDGKWGRTAPNGDPETLCGKSGQAEMFGGMTEGRGAAASPTTRNTSMPHRRRTTGRRAPNMGKIIQFPHKGAPRQDRADRARIDRKLDADRAAIKERIGGIRGAAAAAVQRIEAMRPSDEAWSIAFERDADFRGAAVRMLDAVEPGGRGDASLGFRALGAAIAGLRDDIRSSEGRLKRLMSDMGAGRPLGGYDVRDTLTRPQRLRREHALLCEVMLLVVYKHGDVDSILTLVGL